MEKGQHRNSLHFTASEDVTSPRKKRRRGGDGERDNSRREMGPLDENANYSTSYWTSVKPPTSHNKSKCSVLNAHFT